MSEKTVIIGLGNILLKDEGFGVHAIKELKKQNLPMEVELIDAGTVGLDVLASLKDITKLIIIDAITYGKQPGTIYCFYPEDLCTNSTTTALSLHQISVLESLSVVKKMGNLPKAIVIIGIEPKEVNWGLELSPEIRQKLPQLIQRVLKEISQLEKVKA